MFFFELVEFCWRGSSNSALDFLDLVRQMSFIIKNLPGFQSSFVHIHVSFLAKCRAVPFFEKELDVNEDLLDGVEVLHAGAAVEIDQVRRVVDVFEPVVRLVAVDCVHLVLFLLLREQIPQLLPLAFERSVVDVDVVLRLESFAQHFLLGNYVGVLE